MSERPVVDRVAELEAALAAKDVEIEQMRRNSALCVAVKALLDGEDAEKVLRDSHDAAIVESFRQRAEAAESALQQAQAALDQVTRIGIGHMERAQALESEVATIRSQLEAAKLDSERLDWILYGDGWKWLKQQDDIHDGCLVFTREQIDFEMRVAAIDAARSEGKPESGEGR